MSPKGTSLEHSGRGAYAKVGSVPQLTAWLSEWQTQTLGCKSPAKQSGLYHGAGNTPLWEAVSPHHRSDRRRRVLPDHPSAQLAPAQYTHCPHCQFVDNRAKPMDLIISQVINWAASPEPLLLLPGYIPEINLRANEANYQQQTWSPSNYFHWKGHPKQCIVKPS